MAVTEDQKATYFVPKSDKDRKGHQIFYSQLAERDYQFALAIAESKHVIPVIFIPGVMGSNLKTTVKHEKQKKLRGESVWLLNGEASMLGWFGESALTRKTLLNPDTTEVFDKGKVGLKDKVLEQIAQDRGWGQVGYMSYGAFLHELQDALNDFQLLDDEMLESQKVEPHGDAYEKHQMEDDNKKVQTHRRINKINIDKKKLTDLVDQEFGAEKGESALTTEEEQYARQFSFPVHAFGYNWLKSNVTSAKALENMIEKTINTYKKRGKHCEQVILVTHSMGGLVARYCAKNNDKKKRILGIVHGVMPAIGAGVFYRRMKMGTEAEGLQGWAVAKILGATQAKMTASLAHSPGPLQLLPTKEYSEGEGWLKIAGVGHLPEKDPYTEIYLVRNQWWSMCEDKLIDPSLKNPTPAQLDEGWNKYATIINRDVKPFHTNLEGYYHPNTHIFYGSDAAHLSFGDVSVQQTNGKIHIAKGDDHGDGTVSLRSGVAPSSNQDVKSVLKLAIEHEPAYQNKAAQSFTLRAILKMVQTIEAVKT